MQAFLSDFGRACAGAYANGPNFYKFVTSFYSHFTAPAWCGG